MKADFRFFCLFYYRHIYIFITVFITVFIFILTFSDLAFSEELKKEFIDFTVLTQIQHKKDQIEGQEQLLRKLLSNLYEINRKLKKIETEKSLLEKSFNFLEMQSKFLALQILDMNKNEKMLKNQLRNRLKAMYKLNGRSTFHFLFSSENISDLDKNIKLISLINKKDLQLIRKYELSLIDLKAKKKNFSTKIKQLEKVRKSLDRKERVLIISNKNKIEILNQLKTKKEDAKTELESLKRESNLFSDNGSYDLLFENSFLEKKGNLPHPLDEPVLIKTKYGLIKNTKHHVVLDHKGLFYSAPYGSEVKAVFQGVVSFIGHLEGYGQTIILDHGDHYYSVYAYNKEIFVQVGQKVLEKELISKTGEVSMDYGLGLYFEIRHFSEPHDPSKWLKGAI